MDNADLVNLVTKLTHDVAKLGGDEDAVRRCKSTYIQTHKRFVTMYPKLFEMCFSPAFDAQHFTYMMNQLERIQDDRTSFETGTSNVCEMLNQKYIIPLVGKAHTDVDTTDMNHIKFSVTKGEK